MNDGNKGLCDNCLLMTEKQTSVNALYNRQETLLGKGQLTDSIPKGQVLSREANTKDYASLWTLTSVFPVMGDESKDRPRKVFPQFWLLKVRKM